MISVGQITSDSEVTGLLQTAGSNSNCVLHFYFKAHFCMEGPLWQTVAQTSYNKASLDAEDNRNQIICS